MSPDRTMAKSPPPDPTAFTWGERCKRETARRLAPLPPPSFVPKAGAWVALGFAPQQGIILKWNRSVWLIRRSAGGRRWSASHSCFWRRGCWWGWAPQRRSKCDWQAEPAHKCKSMRVAGTMHLPLNSAPVISTKTDPCHRSVQYLSGVLMCNKLMELQPLYFSSCCHIQLYRVPPLFVQKFVIFNV